MDRSVIEALVTIYETDSQYILPAKVFQDNQQDFFLDEPGIAEEWVPFTRHLEAEGWFSFRAGGTSAGPWLCRRFRDDRTLVARKKEWSAYL